MVHQNERAQNQIRVRIGLHTGEPMQEEEDFYGRHVNLASRIADAARGGEILVSLIVKELTEGGGNVRFGEGRQQELKGISTSQQVVPVIWGDEQVSDERYLSTITGVIRNLASHDDMVIIGRGSQVILGNWPGAIHVLLVAPFQYRLQQFARREGLNEGEAATREIDADKARLAFHRKFFNVDADDPSLYHLTLNAERVSIREAGRTIAGLAKPG